MNEFSYDTIRKDLPVFRTILSDKDEVNPHLKSLILSYRKEHPEGYDTNVRAWRSAHGSHVRDKKFSFFVKRIESACNLICREPFGDVSFFKCSNMWMMQYEKNDSAYPHDHFPSVWSCVYYVEVDNWCSPIIFEKTLEIRPQNGLLLIFPSIIEHEVPPTEGQRMAISMNFRQI